MQLMVEKRGYRWLPLLLLATAIVALAMIARDTRAETSVGNFEIDDTCPTAPTTPCTGPVDPATCPQGSVQCNWSYYSGATDGVLTGDDWVDGGTGNGVFKFSESPPHTASDPDLSDATAVTCYGSGVDFDSPGGIARFLCDGYGKNVGVPTPEMNIVSPAGDIPDDQWPIKAGSLGAPKDDSTHGFFLQRVQSRTCNGVTSDHNIVIPAYERTNSEGEFHQGIELNAVPPRGLLTVANNADPGANFKLDYNRQVGDLFISMDVERGGAIPNLRVLRVANWEGSGLVDPPVGTVLPDGGPGPDGIEGTTDDPQGPDALYKEAAPTVCSEGTVAVSAVTNLLEQTAPPWNTIVGDPTADNSSNSPYLANGDGVTQPDTLMADRDFVEAAVDLTLFGVTRACFSDVIYTTRTAGPSPTPDAQGFINLANADVKDIMGTFLPPCSLSWEKRDGSQGSAGSHPLQGGATFTVGTVGGSDGDGLGPFACNDANFTGDDDKNPVTVVDDVSTSDSPDVAPDADDDAGQVLLPNVCPGTYTITETVAPGGYLKDIDTTRVCTVSAADATCVIGSPLTAPPSTDDEGTRDGSGECTDNECDFHNRRGSVAWEKRDGSLDPAPPQGGATFTISPNPDACVDANSDGADDASPVTVPDDVSSALPDTNLVDDNDSPGVLEVGPACIATYTITETVPPPGFALPANPVRTCEVTAAEPNCVVGSQGTDDCLNPTAAERDFCNRLGSLEWEKRSDIDGHLQGGATFTVDGADANSGDTIAGNDGVFRCHDTDTLNEQIPGADTGVEDEDDPLTVVDDTDGTGTDAVIDKDPDGGQIRLERVCLGTYTITETAVPPSSGFAPDPDPTRVCTVSATTLSCVVGTALQTPPTGADPPTGNDGCPDADDAGGDDVPPGSDFCNVVGSLFWEKLGKDASTPATGNELLPGFQFSVTGGSVNFTNIADCTTGTTCTAGAGLDQDPDAGQFCLNNMPLNTALTITETAKATGYIQTSPVDGSGNPLPLTKTLTLSSNCTGAGTAANDAGDFINTPLSKFKIDFICVAPSPSDTTEPRDCATQANISCTSLSPTPADGTPADFDDVSETYGDGTSALLPNVSPGYQCTIKIDP